MSFIIGDSSKNPFKNSKLQPKYSTLQPILETRPGREKGRESDQLQREV